jgi:hypothetical protein
MPSSPHKIFRKIGSEAPEYLILIADRKNIILSDDNIQKPRKRVPSIFAKIAVAKGLQLYLTHLTQECLKMIADDLDVKIYTEERTKRDGTVVEAQVVQNPQKKILVHKLYKNFVPKDSADDAVPDLADKFQQLNKSTLRKMCEIVDDIDEDDKYGKNELINDGIIVNINTMGLENFLDAFDIETIKRFCTACNLEVITNNKEHAISALIDQSHFREKKVKRKVQKPSKKKPAIKSGVKAVDLQHHFNKTELVEYCKKKNLYVSGNKRQVIQRILSFLAGDTESTVRPADGGRRKKRKRGPGKKSSKKKAKN